jgi:hypothetical protein
VEEVPEVRFYPENLDHFLAWLKCRIRPGLPVLVSGFSVVVICPTKDDAWKTALWAYHNYQGRVRFRVEE